MAASAPGTGAGRRVRHGAPLPRGSARRVHVLDVTPVRHQRVEPPPGRGLVGARAARELGLAVDGVNYHLRRLSARWGAANRTELVARAYALGVLVPGVWPPETRPDGTG